MSLHLNNDIDCCGISELVDIQLANKPEDAILRVYQHMHDQGIILFSEKRERKQGTFQGIGEDIRKFIAANKLGTVVRLPTTINPNTSNYIRAYLWRVNRTNMIKWGEAYIAANPRYRGFESHYNPWRRPEVEAW